MKVLISKDEYKVPEQGNLVLCLVFGRELSPGGGRLSLPSSKLHNSSDVPADIPNCPCHGFLSGWYFKEHTLGPS